MEYWREYPPTHVLVGAYMGAGKEVSRPNTVDMDSCNDADLEAFTRDMNGLGG